MPTGNAQSTGGPWSDGERYKFLCLVISHMAKSGATLDLKQIAPKMGGRTVKALTHMMSRIRDEAANFDAANANGSDASAASTPAAKGRGRGRPQSGTPTPASTGRKHKASDKWIPEAGEADLDDDVPPVAKKPKKAASKASNDEDQDYGKSLMPPPPLPAPKPRQADQVRYRKTVPVSADESGSRRREPSPGPEPQQEHARGYREMAPSPTATLDGVYEAIANAQLAAAAADEAHDRAMNTVKQEAGDDMDQAEC